jgi:hypothetical protein
MASGGWDADDVDLHTLGDNHGKDVSMPVREWKAVDEEKSVSVLLVEGALRRAMPARLRRKLAAGKAGCVLVTVPSAQWVRPMEEALADINPEIWVLARTAEKKKDDDANYLVSRKLGEGVDVVGLSTSERHLPPILSTLGEHRIAVAPLDRALVAAVVRKVARKGRLPASFSKVDVGVLDLEELAGLVVAGSDAGLVASRIAAAVQAKTRMSRPGEVLPDMAEAVEFGDARLFAMELKQDLVDLRSGLIGEEAVDKGICLYGPPGTGKTVWARSLGEYLGVPVVVASMGDFFANGSGYLDSVIKAQRAAFERARACAPSVLFIDEIDALPNVEELGSRGRDWWTPVINDFLGLLDGAASDRNGVIVVGATNRVAGVSPSVLRPGRLERAVYMGPPSPEGVVRIIRHHLGPDLADADLTEIGAICHGLQMTGAVLMEHVRAAKRHARRAKRPMEVRDLLDCILPPSPLSGPDKRRVAVHEAGHALIGYLNMPREFVSVTMGGGIASAGGSTVFDMTASQIRTRRDLEARVEMLLAGRAAEQVLLGDASTGAGGTGESDIARATEELAAASLSYGLGKRLLWRCDPSEAVRRLDIDRELRSEVEADLAALAEAALATVRSRREAVQAIADALQERRTLSAAEVAGIVARTLDAPTAMGRVA